MILVLHILALAVAVQVELNQRHPSKYEGSLYTAPFLESKFLDQRVVLLVIVLVVLVLLRLTNDFTNNKLICYSSSSIHFE